MRIETVPVMHQISDLAQLATRTRAVNEALGTHLLPDEIAATWPDESIDLLMAWSEHTRPATSDTLALLRQLLGNR